jgi:hypothetical protein
MEPSAGKQTHCLRPPARVNENARRVATAGLIVPGSVEVEFRSTDPGTRPRWQRQFALVFAMIELFMVHFGPVLHGRNLRFAGLFAPERAPIRAFFSCPTLLPGFPGFLDDFWKSTVQRSPCKIAAMSIDCSSWVATRSLHPRATIAGGA